MGTTVVINRNLPIHGKPKPNRQHLGEITTPACVAIMVATSQSLPMWSERKSSKQPRRETSPLASMAILAVISLD
jgi:hypothetical protein